MWLLGQRSQAHSGVIGVLCAGPGAAVGGPDGSLPTQHRLWFCLGLSGLLLGSWSFDKALGPEQRGSDSLPLMSCAGALPPPEASSWAGAGAGCSLVGLIVINK